MSETKIAALDHTIQMTNGWLKTLQIDNHLPERQHAYSALRSVLHVLRDRLMPEMSVKFGAQLPILVRGIFYEGWHMAGCPTSEHSVDQFVERVAAQLPPNFPHDALATTKMVFALLWQELDPGETAKVIDTLPAPLRGLWPAEARR